MTSTMDKKELEPLWLKQDKQGTGKNKFGHHSGWKEIQDLIRWKEHDPQFEMMSEESNITMPPEERIEDKSLE